MPTLTDQYPKNIRIESDDTEENTELKRYPVKSPCPPPPKDFSEKEFRLGA